jgi:hypothetical protein
MMNPVLIYVFVFAFLLVLAIYLQKKFCILCNLSISDPKPYSFSRWQLVWWTFIIFASFISVIIASGKIPTFSDSTLILLGIGSLTTISARLIDITDDNNAAAAAAAAPPAPVVVVPPATLAPLAPVANASAPIAAPVIDPAAPVVVNPVIVVPPTIVVPATPILARDIKHANFLLDVLSDKNGISIHRLQAFIFNLIFGVWFIYTSFERMKGITVNSSQTLVDLVIPVITSNNLILLGVSAGLYATLKTTENK